MCFSNKQHYVSPLKKQQQKNRIKGRPTMFMSSRNLPAATCGLTLIQNRYWTQDSETKFLLFEL